MLPPIPARLLTAPPSQRNAKPEGQREQGMVGRIIKSCLVLPCLKDLLGEVDIVADDDHSGVENEPAYSQRKREAVDPAQ